jgi:hypothetical protein
MSSKASATQSLQQTRPRAVQQLRWVAAGAAAALVGLLAAVGLLAL